MVELYTRFEHVESVIVELLAPQIVELTMVEL